MAQWQRVHVLCRPFVDSCSLKEEEMICSEMCAIQELASVAELETNYGLAVWND